MWQSKFVLKDCQNEKSRRITKKIRVATGIEWWKRVRAVVTRDGDAGGWSWWRDYQRKAIRPQKKLETRRGRRAVRLAKSRAHFNTPLQLTASRVMAGSELSVHQDNFGQRVLTLDEIVPAVVIRLFPYRPSISVLNLTFLKD